MDIHHTSHTDTGQIYLPMVNTFLLFGVMMLVLIFQTSESLATAYGISVTGAMVVTTVMFFDFLRIEWKWSLAAALALVLPLATLELVFLGANLIKIHDGGYVRSALRPGGAGDVDLAARAAIVSEKSRRSHVALRAFVKSIEKKSAHGPHLIPGCGIFLTSEPEATPSALLHNIKHNRVLHQQNIILTIRTDAARPCRRPNGARWSGSPSTSRC